jgi:hypothetical protein
MKTISAASSKTQAMQYSLNHLARQIRLICLPLVTIRNIAFSRITLRIS